mmetsp:Transcript_2479/g.5173  ORF Transcript_2479/g.5173 Transcript_2479/m.5173 type:complete len:229 (-) Transcript_2479:1435-2121(-)
MRCHDTTPCADSGDRHTVACCETMGRGGCHHRRISSSDVRDRNLPNCGGNSSLSTHHLDCSRPSDRGSSNSQSTAQLEHTRLDDDVHSCSLHRTRAALGGRPRANSTGCCTQSAFRLSAIFARRNPGTRQAGSTEDLFLRIVNWSCRCDHHVDHNTPSNRNDRGACQVDNTVLSGCGIHTDKMNAVADHIINLMFTVEKSTPCTASHATDHNSLSLGEAMATCGQSNW